VTGSGNRYSVDGSYDLVWDGRFPVDGDLLWPNDVLLQLRHFAFSSHFIERRHILTLTSNRLTIAEESKPEDDESFDVLDMGEGYRFLVGVMENERSYEPWGVTRVELLRSIVSQGIGIYVQDERRQSKKVFRAQEVGISMAIVDVADAYLRKQGVEILGDRQTQRKEVYEFRGRLMYREIERQFRRVAPQAEFVLKGNHLPLESFQQVIR